jgi:hypothetical protein
MVEIILLQVGFYDWIIPHYFGFNKGSISFISELLLSFYVFLKRFGVD